MKCPKCGNTSEVICSNDCGTAKCNKHGYYYQNFFGHVSIGHSPICGNFYLMEKYREKKETRKARWR